MRRVQPKRSALDNAIGELASIDVLGAEEYYHRERERQHDALARRLRVTIPECEYNVITKGDTVRMNPVTKERLINELAPLIDGDSPPGLAAHRLARAAVSLIVEREPAQAIRLAKDLEDLNAEYTRPTQEGDGG